VTGAGEGIAASVAEHVGVEWKGKASVCANALDLAAGEPLREIALTYAVDHSAISRLMRHLPRLI
jgi:hypothetical protein